MKLLAVAEEESELNKKEAGNDRTNNNNTDETHSETEFKKESMKPFIRKKHKESCGESSSEPIKGKISAEEEEKLRRLLPYEDAPEHLQHNPYIRHGYRGYLTTKLCLESVFWWTNETINIWSHIFGWMLFFGLTLYDLCLLNIHASFGDKLIVALLLICFQACMILSSVYHTFSCRSAKDYICFLSFDLFGIALSLLSIYMSGVYYAFWCHKDLQQFYLITVLAIFIFAMILQIPSLNVNETVKLVVFVAWAAYGVLPTLHWSLAMGGMDNPIVRMLLPRVLGMYIISGGAFAIYLSKIPERFYPGWVDYVGSSHQWWHALIVIALYYWHNTGPLFAMECACAMEMGGRWSYQRDLKILASSGERGDTCVAVNPLRALFSR
ncbi:hypothetical protein KM043_002385 [Ampulex compressa]|nr:hypothetical protein KM043_002385 [Ampulex compressa]